MSRKDVTGILRNSEICHGQSQIVTGIFFLLFFTTKKVSNDDLGVGGGAPQARDFFWAKI